MRVFAQNLDVEPDGQIPFEAEGYLGAGVGSDAAALPETAVGAEEVGVPLDNRVEVRARNLLFPFDNPADRRQCATGLPQGSNRREANADLGLVVGRAPRIEAAVPHRRLERRRLPELD